MSLVGQWSEIEAALATSWSEACLVLTIAEDDCVRAATLLGPAGPGRSGSQIHFRAASDGTGVAPEAITRLLRRLDAERIEGRLELVSSDEAAPEEGEGTASPTLVEAWDRALAELPADWSDLYCELELTSSDHLEPAALLAAPINPARDGDRLAFRFRVARSFGYGVSAGMARRCLARLVEASIPGTVRVLRALSDTKPVGTQGPVWYVGGRAV